MSDIPVLSSNLMSVDYDYPTKTLWISFKGGTIYEYSGVPLNVYVGLLSASSKGSYHHQHIKFQFPYKKL